MEQEPIAITGANGFVARNLRALCCRMKIPVVAIARRSIKTYENETPVITQDYRADRILPDLQRCRGMVHLVGIGRQGLGSTYSQTNVDLTRRVISMCKTADAGKMVYCSGLGVSEYPSTDYFASKFDAERMIIGSGLDYTIFRPSYIIGADDPLTKSVGMQIAAGTVVVPGSGRSPIQPIAVGDACRVILQSMTDERFSRRIIDMVGPSTIPFGRFVRGMVAGRAAIKQMETETAYYEAIRNPGFPYGVDDLNILMGRFWGDHKEIQNLAGFEFATPVEMLTESGSRS